MNAVAQETFDDTAAAAVRTLLASRGSMTMSDDRRVMRVLVHAEEAVMDLMALAARERIAVRTRASRFAAPAAEPAGRWIQLDVSAFDGIVRHDVADFVVRVRAGTRLRALHEAVARAGQRLPLDPPDDDDLTVGELVACNAWGPRRTGYGPVREHLLGARYVPLGGGVALKTGGIVVKAATGFDVHRLQVGALETLAVLVECTFRLRPDAEARATLAAEYASRADAIAAAFAVREPAEAPAALCVAARPDAPAKLMILFEGSAAAVGAAVEAAMRATPARAVADGEAEKEWDAVRRAGANTMRPGESAVALRITCRPSRVAATAAALERVHARAAFYIHPGIAAIDFAPLGAAPAEAEALLERASAAAGGEGESAVRLLRPYNSFGAVRARTLPDGDLDVRLKRAVDGGGLLNPGLHP